MCIVPMTFISRGDSMQWLQEWPTGGLRVARRHRIVGHALPTNEGALPRIFVSSVEYMCDADRVEIKPFPRDRPVFSSVRHVVKSSVTAVLSLSSRSFALLICSLLKGAVALRHSLLLCPQHGVFYCASGISRRKRT